jgi:carbamate kinase
MLIDAKEILRVKLLQILQDAYMTQFSPNSVTELSMFDADVKKSYEAQALKFAEAAAEPMANAMYDFVRSAGITATITTVTSPAGPCTGVISPVDFKIT